MAVVGVLTWRLAARPDVSPEVASLLRDLRRRPAAYQRLATTLAETLRPRLARHLPAFLQTETVERRRLEACHRLLALGPAVRAAAPALAKVVNDPDPTVAFYGFLALVYSGLPAEEATALIARQARAPAEPIRFYASLLGTEDERVREFAWRCLESSGTNPGPARPRLEDLATSGDPEQRRRAKALLNQPGRTPVGAVSADPGQTER